jgi:hypothetical protein
MYSGANAADGLANGFSLVAAEIIHNHNVAGLQPGQKEFTDIGKEPDAGDRSVKDQGASIRSQRKAARKVCVRQ